MWRLCAGSRQPPGSFAACTKLFSGWLIGRHGTEGDRHTLTNHGGSGRGGSLRGDGALPTEFPMTAPFGRACIGDGQRRLEDGAQQERAAQGACAFTSWLHSVHALFQPCLTLIGSYEMLLPSHVAAGLCRTTQRQRSRASRSHLLSWDKETLMNSFLPLIVTVRTYFCPTIFNSNHHLFSSVLLSQL